MAGDCTLNRWDWKEEPGFPFPFPLKFDATFYARFKSDLEVRVDVVALLHWLRYRNLECVAYEDTLVWPQTLQKLSLHVYPPPTAEATIFSGFAFEWSRRQIHAMALWHRADPMNAATFVQRARNETKAMAG